MAAVDIVRRLTFQVREEGVAATKEKVEGLSRSERDLNAAQRTRMTTTEAVERASQRLTREYQQMVRMQQEMVSIERTAQTLRTQQVYDMQRYADVQRSQSAANNNLAQSAKDVSEGWRSQVVEIAALTNHLKFAALAAYAWSPAFRAMVNPAIAASVAALGPAAVSAGATIVSAMSPALLFLGKIALPILAIVAVWKVLNSLVDQGAELLEKYGNAGRRFDSATAKGNLEKLTALQPNDTVSLQQQQYAAELAGRLADAKFRLQEFMKVQFNLNDVALFFQKIWVNIVEIVAKAADGVTKMIGLIGQAWEKLTSLGTQIGMKIGAAIGAYLPENIKAALTPASAVAPKGDFDVDSHARALRIARSNLSAALGVAAGADKDANIGSTFAARWSASIDALVNKTPKAKEEVAAVAREFDRLERSMQRAAAVQEAEAKAIDASVGEHARLRAEMRLQEVVQQDIAKHGGKMEDYAERIKTLADRFGVAAQRAAELKLQSDVKFTGDVMFLSDTDKQIASILRQIHGAEWKGMMDSPIANTMRWHAALKTANNEIGSSLATIATETAKGVPVMTALANQAQRVAESVLQASMKQLSSQAFGSLIGDTAGLTTGAATAATSLTTAGATLSAQMVAGAAQAAALLTGAGLVTATEITAGSTTGAAAMQLGGQVAGLAEAAGGAAGGGSMAAGGTVAGLAIASAMGPIGLALAAITAVVSLVLMSGKKRDIPGEMREIQELQERRGGYNTRAALAYFDPESLDSRRVKFDLDTQMQLYEEDKKGNLARTELLNARHHEWIVEERNFNKEVAEEQKRHQQEILDRQSSIEDAVFLAVQPPKPAANDNKKPGADTQKKAASAA